MKRRRDWQKRLVRSKEVFGQRNIFNIKVHVGLDKMAWEQKEIRDLKENRYMVIDDEPCKINSIDTSKPGKHGEAKARIEAVGIFDKKKHSMINPVTHKVKVPIIDRRKGQIVSISEADGEVNIMDLDSYDTFQLQVDEETMDEIEQGQEIRYLETMGQRKITQT